MCDEAEVMGLAPVYRAGLHLCKVHWDCERSRNDPERQDTQLYRRQNIKNATQLASVFAQLDSVCSNSYIYSICI